MECPVGYRKEGHEKVLEIVRVHEFRGIRHLGEPQSRKLNGGCAVLQEESLGYLGEGLLGFFAQLVHFVKQVW